MQGIKWVEVVLVVALLSACATGSSATKDPMAQRVASLVEATTHKATEAQAFVELESLGDDAVPYLIGQLGDERTLPIKQISLVNKAPEAFEGVRHYSPKAVHDALSAVLNQITGKSFEFVYNGSTSAEREADRRQWQDWCAKAYPEKISVCRGA
jgi:hypothetical protein